MARAGALGRCLIPSACAFSVFLFGNFYFYVAIFFWRAIRSSVFGCDIYWLSWFRVIVQRSALIRNEEIDREDHLVNILEF